MNQYEAVAEKYGISVAKPAPDAEEIALAVAEDANEAVFAWACALAQTKTPQGYIRPEHAFAIAYALGSFFLVLSRAQDCHLEAYSACRNHYIGHLSIDLTTEEEMEQALLDELMHRAADLALHGRQPGKSLVVRLMENSLIGLLHLDAESAESQTVLSSLTQLIQAIENAGTQQTLTEGGDTDGT